MTYQDVKKTRLNCLTSRRKSCETQSKRAWYDEEKDLLSELDDHKHPLRWNQDENHEEPNHRRTHYSTTPSTGCLKASPQRSHRRKPETNAKPKNTLIQRTGGRLFRNWEMEWLPDINTSSWKTFNCSLYTNTVLLHRF